ncbi:hypothetical protein [Tranquillimonas alkanivorans]|uniref:Uncharacterized protein n=1 Tax=Tranquillimonas alkanivorans TaxID=441119 RepID=A0A1I5SI15_9RHOB|nr:hypothetical protein [Tranquillimonas alkanivorans]SFP70301.1 hypothetical protein SAMN04488047_11124 [Tranquillimonas alkanivorans]
MTVSDNVVPFSRRPGESRSIRARLGRIERVLQVTRAELGCGERSSAQDNGSQDRGAPQGGASLRLAAEIEA